MTWLKHPEQQYDGNVSVNGNIYTFKNGVAQVDNEQDVAIFEEYLQCIVVPEEVAKPKDEAPKSSAAKKKG